VHVTAKVLPLRDFFLTLFFLSIGMKIPFPDAATLTMALLIVLFVIMSRFFTVYPILALSGSGRRTSFITSLNLAQISEFSLVVAALGVSYGHITQPLMSLIIYAMAITSVLASYFIKGNHQLYLAFDSLLTKIGFPSDAMSEDAAESHEHYPIVILGFHRGASALIDKLEEIAPELLKKVLVIDFNLEALRALGHRNVKGIFGDISSLDTLDHAHVAGAEMILSTIPDMLLKGTNNMTLVKACRAIAPNAHIVATADSSEQIEALKRQGANDVLLPYSLIGDRIAHMIVNIRKTQS
jgi:voltage-gated potassium channel Kch